MNSDEEKSKRSMPAWLPVSVFIGTSLAIAVPLFMIRKAKSTALQTILKNPSSAPPRRAPRNIPSITGQIPSPRRPIRPIPIPIQSQSSSTPTDFDSPSTSQLFSAISKTNLNTALLAGKAFFIATCLVGVGACGLVYSVQSLMGVNNVPDFARRMRYLANKYLSGVTSRIHRAPENAEERRVSYQVAPVGADDDNWTWEEAEKRLEQAYDQGGFPLWAQVALRELEVEVRVERTKKQQEIDAESQKSF